MTALSPWLSCFVVSHSGHYPSLFYSQMMAVIILLLFIYLLLLLFIYYFLFIIDAVTALGSFNFIILVFSSAAFVSAGGKAEISNKHLNPKLLLQHDIFMLIYFDGFIIF